MASATLDEPTQVIEQEAAEERKPSRWGLVALGALVLGFLTVWLLVAAVFRVESLTDKVEDYLRAQEATPYHQLLNTRYRLADPCEEVARMAYCQVEEQNELYDRAGVELGYELWVVVDENDSFLQTLVTNHSDMSYAWFLWAYTAWLETAHPHVYQQLPKDGWGDCCAEVEASARAFVTHIDEFLADSEEYPVR